MGHMHFVCTHAEARKLTEERERFWVSNCGCREGGKGCERSRLDVCLFFSTSMSGTGGDFHEVNREFFQELLQHAHEKRLVARPWYLPPELKKLDGICFCCDDCCEYFSDPEATSGKGQFIELTNTDGCTHCGDCVPVCYFGARKMMEEKLLVNRDDCYGCGLCVEVCPTDCIKMVPSA